MNCATVLGTSSGSKRTEGRSSPKTRHAGPRRRAIRAQHHRGRDIFISQGSDQFHFDRPVAVAFIGVDVGRIEVSSCGKERPAATGSTEEAYAQNRRAVTVVIRR